MNKIFTFLLVNSLFAGFGLFPIHQATAAINLTKNGKTAYVISLATDAIPAEKTAAEQLQKYLGQVTGASFAVRPEGEVDAISPQILVGAGTRAKALLPRQDWKSLGHDGIVIRTVGKNLILAGGRPRGSLYAVFQFLEDSVGCRWWTPTENTIPLQSTLSIATQNVTYSSPFDYREHFTYAVYADPIFATIMRENGYFQRQDVNWGGHYSILGWVHTFSELLPPSKYFKDHPEWYSDYANGSKPGTAASLMPPAQDTQLCLSNPQMLDELTKNALELIARNPDAGYISISQNDNMNFCGCDACRALAKTEEAESGPVLNFVNKVAARIGEKYPDFLVETLAYHGTDKPPKSIRPDKNVVVRVAPIWSDYGHPLNSDWNKETRDNLLGWAKISSQLFVWNYVTNFDNLMVMHPNWAGLGQDLRFFAANNVKGVFEQGEAYEGNEYSTNNVGDFVQLRAWVMGKLLWNPALDQERLTTEFVQGYYGPAAPYLKKYLDLLQASFLAQNRKLSTYNKDFTFITLDVANESIRLFDQAEAAVKDDLALLSRIRRERISVQIALFNRDKALRAAAVREGKEFLGPQDPQAALVELIASARAYGVTDAFLGTQIPRLRERLAPLPEFAKAFPGEDVIDLQPHIFKLYKPSINTAKEDDAQASAGTAAYMRGESNEWDIQIPAGDSLDTLTDSWRVYAVMRLEKNPTPPAGAKPTDLAFAAGMYDPAVDRRVLNGEGKEYVMIPVAQMADPGYQVIDLGVYKLTGAETYIYFQSPGNAAISKIHLDRVLLIRQKRSQ
jgi:hypothetical protein